MICLQCNFQLQQKQTRSSAEEIHNHYQRDRKRKSFLRNSHLIQQNRLAGDNTAATGGTDIEINVEMIHKVIHQAPFTCSP